VSFRSIIIDLLISIEVTIVNGMLRSDGGGDRHAAGVRAGRRRTASEGRFVMARVLFVCRQNAGRSQMSQALFARAAAGRHQARSAGTTPATHVHPVVIEVMDELGIDLRERTPTLLTRELAEWSDVVVTMGCGDECPYVPGKRYVDWDLLDPAGRSAHEARAVREDIALRVSDLLTDLDARGREAAAARAVGLPGPTTQ
jgi:arsenate reductase